ncbi:MAG: TPM domain-containing protein [Acidobacteriaceae bacterium]|nr:TPM domain-containing protein [Acidobacteriaceae bacterium]
MRKIWLSLLTIALATCAVASAETVASLGQPTAYVNDYANVLSSQAKEEDEALCREVHDKTHAQIFVATVKTLDGTDVDQYANDLFHTWKIGEKKTDRGVLILLATNDHKYRIEVGYGLEGALNDAKAGDIGRSMVPALRARDYDSAVAKSLVQVAETIAADAKVTLQDQPQAANPDGLAPPERSATHPRLAMLGGVLGVLLVFGLIGGTFIFLFFVIRALLRAARKGPRGGSSGGGSSAVGWSSWSDSSSSSSDSGSSFSGGDGGDSGGGGASGDW